ncbi:MAG: tetratricopeptide repeat protein, partial [Deltaproteobacteria bacterium]
NNLAGLYYTTGRYAEAEPLYKRALTIYEKVLGPEHASTTASLNNLAGLYYTTGRYAEAEPMLKRALAIREKVLGPEHADTATSLNSLAVLYKTTGRYAEAEPMLKRALAIREKVLGPEHADTANSLNNLAGLYETTGRYAEAEPLHKRALAIREKVLGPEHADTASSLYNLAALYKTTGRYAEAEPLYKRALAIAANAGDPQILRHIQEGFSHLLEKQEKPEAAIFFAKQAVNTIQGLRQNVAKIDKETLNAFQKTVDSTYKRLSNLLIDAGRLPEAQQVMELLKQEEYFEYVRRDAKEEDVMAGRATYTGTEASLDLKYRQIADPMAILGAERGQLAELKLRTPDQEARLAILDKDLEKAGEAFQMVIVQITTELSEKRQDKVDQIEEAVGLQAVLL